MKKELLLGVLAGISLIVVLLWPAGSSKKVEQLYYEAEQLYSQNDYEGSIEKYNLALEESVKWGVKTEVIDKDFNTLANYKIAVNYLKWAEQSGDITYYDNAIDRIEKVAPNATVPKHREGLTYLWGHILYKQGKLELAGPKFDIFIVNFPNSLFVEEVYYYRGITYLQKEDYDRAIIDFAKVIELNPYHAHAYEIRGLLYIRKGNYARANTAFTKAKKLRNTR